MAIFGVGQGGQSQVKPPIDWGAALADLSFIPIISDWLELLASRLAQPMMFIASLWIIAETTVPGADAWSPWLNTLTMTVMSMAPEVISPGCFIQAGRAHKEGKENRAKLLFTLFGTCLALLGITIAVAVWKLDKAWPWVIGLILFIRCGVGIAYTVILKIDKESAVVIAQPTQPAPATQALPTPEDLAVLIAQSVENAVAPLRAELRSVQRFVQIAQQSVRIEEIAQQPAPIEISSEQPSERPKIAQRSVMSSEHNETARGDQVSEDDDDSCADDDTPLAQQDTQPVEVIKAQRNMRKAIFEYLESQPDPMSLTDDDVMTAISGCTKSQSRRYRGQYKALRGGVQ